MLEDSDLDFYSPGPGDDKDSDDDDLQDDTDDLEEEIHVTQFNGTINKSEWNFTEKMCFFVNLKYLNGVSNLFENPRKSKNSRKVKLKIHENIEYYQNGCINTKTDVFNNVFIATLKIKICLLQTCLTLLKTLLGTSQLF